MSAGRNTLLVVAFQLFTFLFIAAAWGASSPDICGASYDATCEATCAPACTGPSKPAAPSKQADCCDFPDLRNLGSGPCDWECGELADIFRGYTWRADASALILHRASPGTRIVLSQPTTGADLFDASRLGFPFAAGPRASLIGLDCQGWGFEVNYFGIDGWSTTRDLPNLGLQTATGNLAIDGIEAPRSLTTAHFESIARLYSSESNFRCPLFGDISFLAGFRWVELTDRYFASGASATTRNTVSEVIWTHNDMYGFQLGADGTIAKQADCWKINGFVKAGAFLNNAYEGASLSDVGGLGVQSANGSNDVGSFFGEAGITGTLQITKHLSANAGYQVMFIDNVAQPVNQISGLNLANSTAVVDTSAGLFYHGASVGLELDW